MWIQDDVDFAPSDSDGESGSEDEGQMQCEVLEKQRDDANQKLSELEEVSGQLLKEMNVLEIQFQIERSCRESAEALAVKVTRENKVLKRRSQMLLPLISELPENLALDLSKDPSEALFDEDESAGADGGDVCDAGPLDDPLLQSQAKITELQASVDGLLTEKLRLESQVELLTKEQTTLQEQLAVESQEKEAILRRMNRQSKTMNKIKRVSELVTEEFTEMSQRLELEQGLRQHAEVWAVQMLEVQKRNATPAQSHETNAQLQQALRQISQICEALSDIQRYYQVQANQSSPNAEEVALRCELQVLKEKLKTSENEKSTLEIQLTEASSKVTQLQQEVKHFADSQTLVVSRDEPEEEKHDAGVPPPPPPPPLPPPAAPVVDTLEVLKQRRKEVAAKSNRNNGTPIEDMKSKAVDEMMERIRKGVILRPTIPVLDDDSAWKDQRSDNRKSAIVELKGVLNNLKLKPHRRVSSRRGLGRNVGENELLSVLQRRRRVMGDGTEPMEPTPAQSTQDQPTNVKSQDVSWISEGRSHPVLRRIKQNRDQRDSRIRASVLVIDPDKPPQ